jgi:hypothetical protein
VSFCAKWRHVDHPRLLDEVGGVKALSAPTVRWVAAQTAKWVLSSRARHLTTF